ncbi:S-locus glycoprotein domain [Dillenia turbinata]|uniref:Receptor-like serine/threonine-protein kinase n=1 Tax=Dillenia turbinata TaxID=194707 RepID=A0AAN8UML7_9MAGN
MPPSLLFGLSLLTFSLSLSSSTPVITQNTTLLSPNRTFELGFFTPPGNPHPYSYLGIWYYAIPTRSYVWVANRKNPVMFNESSSFSVSIFNGKLVISVDQGFHIWETDNVEHATVVQLLENGNLVLVSNEGKTVWQSFDFPADVWLPEMNITKDQLITCWRSSSDPSPGLFSLRLKPPVYGEFELVFNNSIPYWSTGNWTGNSFSGIPEMTVTYIYKFWFVHPYTKAASFWYTVIPPEMGLKPPLTHFRVEPGGQVRQYTWFPQIENWNMFWSQPENRCRVYGLCGNLGFCNSKSLMPLPCECLNGFEPVNLSDWESGDFSGGCKRRGDEKCDKKDVFEEVGVVNYDGIFNVEFVSNGTSRSSCEEFCLSNCSCIGLYYNERTDSCGNLYGSILNLRNMSLDSAMEVLSVRVGRGSVVRKNKWKIGVLIGGVSGLALGLALVVLVLVIVKKKRTRKRREEEEAVYPVTNLKVFSFKELHVATKGFSEKLGHGGFGAVFRGELSCSSTVAVKRLERPGGGEKEFRAEVCTIGNIQHVNLVRLRGFCSENSHRLLVYDYMQNGPLSVFLRRDGPNLRWEVRYRVAIGTARALAYLHEECRDCIIHCDIKPENILLDSDFTAKVSDFGLAKLIGRDFSRVLATMRGTWGYVAPEWISGVAITAKADVYSYGMTLLEIIGGRRNVEPLASAPAGEGENWFFPPWAARQIVEGNVAAVVDDRLGDAYDAAEAERVGLVAVWCIQDDESMRPTMGTVVKMLEGVVEVTVPPPPKLLQALVSGDSFCGDRADSGHGVSSGRLERISHESIQVSGNFILSH